MDRVRATEEIQRLLRGDDELLRRGLEDVDDVQLGAALDNLDPDDQDRLLKALPVQRRTVAVEYMRYETAARIVDRLAPEKAAELLDELDPDDVADILQLLDKPTERAILEQLQPDEVTQIRELLVYDPETAGGIMTRAAVRVHDEVTVAEALRAVQETEDLPDHAFYVHVLDDDERLVGLVTLRTLVTSLPDQSVREVMMPDVITVEPTTDQEVVAEIASRYDVVSVPVVDPQRRLLGVVEIDDIVDVLREEATEDILKMAGAGDALIDTRAFWSSFRARIPWLMAAAVGGLLVAISLSGFDDALRQVPALALFMPVVAGMGGNVGTQSSTIVVRGLAVGYIERGKVARLLLREMSLGASLGLVSGTLVAVAAPFVGAEADPLRLGLVITGGMVGSMVIAATVGTTVPLMLDRFKVDPAVATGPFVTTSVDILGLLFYFALGSYLLGLSS